MEERIEISVVIPFFNEEESLQILYNKLVDVLENDNKFFELIFIDDGSSDGSLSIVSKIQKYDPRVKIIKLKKNCGKASALQEGFKTVNGTIIFTIDADLQDDPNEIPRFLDKINEGYDLVSGWKKMRHDPLEKRIPSKLFNFFTSLLTGLKIHDFNCGFKAYKRAILNEIKVYGELHRYIPALAKWQGYKIGEIAVNHYPRQFGTSKYSWERYLRGMFDLLTIILITRFRLSPIYFFGTAGLLLLFCGMAIFLYISLLQILFGGILGHRPLFSLGILQILLGGQLISLGYVAEFITSLLHNKKLKSVSIKKMVNVRDSNLGSIDLSVIIPIHNEYLNITPLYEQLVKALEKNEQSYEVIFVDDGSTDDSLSLLDEMARENEHIKLIVLRKRFGKASALESGYRFAAGSLIATLDGDLQDDPKELPKLLKKIEEGYDFVSARRTGIPFPRSSISMILNMLISAVTKVNIKDVNSGYVLFKREVLNNIILYGGLERFMPIIVAKKGFRTYEVDVSHRERYSEFSKYNWMRFPKGLFDLVTVLFLTGYSQRPLHFFGSLGLFFTFTGSIICAWLTILKTFTGTIQGHNTLLLFGAMLIVFGFQWISTGLLSEIIVSFYKETEKSNIVEYFLTSK